MREHEGIEDFLATVSSNPDLWRSLDIRVLAFFVQGEWRNALTRCRLFECDPDGVPRLRNLVRTDRVLSLQAVRSIDELPGLLSQVATTELTLGEVVVRYKEESRHQNRESQPYSSHCTFVDLSKPLTWWGSGWIPAVPLKWPNLVLTAGGSSFSDLLAPLPRRERDIDAAIHGAREPLDGLDGAAEFIVGLRSETPHQQNAIFRVEAPFQARFEAARCRLHEGQLELAVQAGSPAARHHLHIGCVAIRGDLVTMSETITLPADSWSLVEDGWIAHHVLSEIDADSVTLLLRIGNQRVERLRIVEYGNKGQNPRLLAYATVDVELETLRAALVPERESGGFERAVARLLVLLGFQALSLGPEKKLSDAADALAFDPHGNTVLVVECTTGAINAGGKLGKLHLRAAALSAKLPDHDVGAVLATASARSGLSPADLEQAARNNTIVLAREDLEEMLRAASEGASVAQAVDFMNSRIPQLPRSSGIEHPGLGGLNRLV